MSFKAYPTVQKILASENTLWEATEDMVLVIFEDVQRDITKDLKLSAGEKVDFDVVWEEEGSDVFKEIQFGDGDVAFNVPKHLFKKV